MPKAQRFWYKFADFVEKSRCRYIQNNNKFDYNQKREKFILLFPINYTARQTITLRQAGCSSSTKRTRSWSALLDFKFIKVGLSSCWVTAHWPGFDAICNFVCCYLNDSIGLFLPRHRRLFNIAEVEFNLKQWLNDFEPKPISLCVI